MKTTLTALALALITTEAMALEVTEARCNYDPVASAYTFALTFDTEPDFETLQRVNGTLRRHHGFRYSVARVPAAPAPSVDFRMALEAWVEDGYVAIHDRAREYVPWPGAVFGHVPYEVQGRSVRFSVAAPMLSPEGAVLLAPGDHIYYAVTWYEWGAEVGGTSGECLGKVAARGRTWGGVKALYQ